LNTSDKDITRRILLFCEVPKLSTDIVTEVGIQDIETFYSRVKHLQGRDLLTKVRVGRCATYQSTSHALVDARMPSHYALDSAWILQTLRDRPGQTKAELTLVKGYRMPRLTGRLLKFVGDGYIVSYQVPYSNRNRYSLTLKGERLLAEIEGKGSKPVRRINSVFALGQF